MKSNKKVVAILPAYNAAKTLEQTLRDIPREWVDDIILVDDASLDGTVALSRKLGLKTFVHEKNLGYGGNQKTCYREALALGADIVVMVHPDHQYNPVFIPQLIEPLLKGECDAVFGSRMIWRDKALEGGMPRWKFIANIFLTRIENLCLGLKLTEYHSGFRAYTRHTLEVVPFERNSNDFVFDTEIIVQMVAARLRIQEIPITTRYFKDASSVNFRRSCKYGLEIIKTLVMYWSAKLGLVTWDNFKK